MGVAVGDSNNDGFPDLLITCVGQNRLFRNTGKGTFVDVTRASGLAGRPGVQHVRPVVRLRSRRAPRSVRLQLRQVVGRARRLLQPRRQAEVVLHAGGVPRRHLLAVPQPRQRHVRGRHGDERHLRHQLEVARRGDARSTIRTAGPISFVANDTQPNKLYRNQRNGTFKDVAVEAGRGVQRRRQGTRRHGRRRRGLRQLGPHEPRRHELRQRDDRPVSAARTRPVRGRRDARGRRRAVAKHARVRLRVRRHGSRRRRSISWSPTATSTRPSGTSAATSATRSRRTCS